MKRGMLVSLLVGLVLLLSAQVAVGKGAPDKVGNPQARQSHAPVELVDGSTQQDEAPKADSGHAHGQSAKAKPIEKAQSASMKPRRRRSPRRSARSPSRRATRRAASPRSPTSRRIPSRPRSRKPHPKPVAEGSTTHTRLRRRWRARSPRRPSSRRPSICTEHMWVPTVRRSAESQTAAASPMRWSGTSSSTASTTAPSRPSSPSPSRTRG